MFNVFSTPINRIKGMGSAMREAYTGSLAGRKLPDVLLANLLKNRRSSAIGSWGGTVAGAGIGYARSDDHPVLGAIGGGVLGNLAGAAGAMGWQGRGALKGIGKAGLAALRGR